MKYTTKIKLIVLGLMLILNSTSYAATWVLITDGLNQDANMKPVTLTDKAYIFYIDDMQCGVSEASLKKIDELYFETRSLYCNVSGDTRVAILISFNVKDANCKNSGNLWIYKKDKSFAPTLAVWCQK